LPKSAIASLQQSAFGELLHQTRHLPLITLHTALGVTILVQAILRLGVQLRSGAPALPADLPKPMTLAAQLSHYALYGLMILMPRHLAAALYHAPVRRDGAFASLAPVAAPVAGQITAVR